MSATESKLIVAVDHLIPGDLLDEEWREYDFNGRKEPYRITAPKTLYVREGGTTHRVLDNDGIVHCIPAPGQSGCVVRWKTKAGFAPVKF